MALFLKNSERCFMHHYQSISAWHQYVVILANESNDKDEGKATRLKG